MELILPSNNPYIHEERGSTMHVRCGNSKPRELFRVTEAWLERVETDNFNHSSA